MKKKKIQKSWIIVWNEDVDDGAEYPDCLYFTRKQALESAKKEAKIWDVETKVVKVEIELK